MRLNNPVTIQPPSFTRKSGEVRTFNPVTLDELDITIMDNSIRKNVVVHIRPCPKPLTLWEGDAYDAIGDYTQAQVETRVMELLGSDIKLALEALFVVTRPNVN